MNSACAVKMSTARIFLLLSFFNKFDYAALCDYWRVKK